MGEEGLYRWHDHALSMVCAQTAEQAGDFAHNLQMVMQPYLNNAPIVASYPLPSEVVSRALYVHGGILPPLLYMLANQRLSLSDVANIDVIVDSSRHVFELFRMAMEKIGYSAKQITSMLKRFRFKVKEIFTNDYFAERQCFRCAIRKVRSVALPREYRVRVLTRAAELVREFLVAFADVLRILQSRHAVDDFRPIAIGAACAKTILYCDRREGVVLIHDSATRQPKTLHISSRAAVVWSVIRKICESPTGEVELALRERNSFRRTDSNNESVHDDLEIFSRHLVSGSRPGFYTFVS